MSVNNLYDTNLSLFGLDFTSVLGPYRNNWVFPAAGSEEPSPCDAGSSVPFSSNCQKLVQQWSNFIGREWFCLPWSFCSDMQGGAFCLELTGAYKKADWIYIFFNYRFESSSHAISMSAYLREQRRELYSRSGELQGMKINTVKVWITLFCRNWASHPCYVKEYPSSLPLNLSKSLQLGLFLLYKAPGLLFMPFALPAKGSCHKTIGEIWTVSLWALRLGTWS